MAVSSILALAAADPTPGDFATTITTGLAGEGTALLSVAGVALASVAIVKWGFPLAMGFFKRIAK